MNYYKLSYGDDDIKIIAARNKYEAVGFYLNKELNNCGCIDDVKIEEIQQNHNIEVSCIGLPSYKTLSEVVDEKGEVDLPSVIVKLDE